MDSTMQTNPSHTNKLTLTFSQRRVLMLDELNKGANSETPYQIVISQLYEALTGETLGTDTDPDNGEDYLYKANEFECASSIGVHEEVVDFFGFKNRYLSGDKNPEGVGYITSDNSEVAKLLSDALKGYFVV